MDWIYSPARTDSGVGCGVVRKDALLENEIGGPVVVVVVVLAGRRRLRRSCWHPVVAVVVPATSEYTTNKSRVVVDEMIHQMLP